jgi:hypothetical protein
MHPTICFRQRRLAVYCSSSRLGLGAETINMAGALRAEHGQLTPELSRVLFEISYVLGYNAAGVGIAVLLGAIVGVAWRSPSLLPRWTAPPLLLLAVAFLTPLCRLLLVRQLCC